MSSFNTEHLVSAHKAVVDSLLSVTNTALASAERLAALNLHALREAVGDMAQGGQAMLSAQSPQQAAELQSQLLKPQLEKGVVYSRSLYEVSSAAQLDASSLLEAQYDGLMKSMAVLADQFAKTTPAGSEVAVAALKTAMDSANKAFARFNSTMATVSEMTEESVSTVGNATVKAATGKK